MSIESASRAPLHTGYGDLAREIKQRGLLRRRPGYYLLVGTALLGSLAALAAGLVLLRNSWWVILLAPLAAVLSTQIAFFAHDIAHRQLARSRRTTELLSLFFGNLLNGLSYGWWVTKHNAHHAHPNDLDSDPDVGPGAFVFDQDQASARRGVAAWMTRHQAGLFFPMLTLEAFNLRVSSVRALSGSRLRHRHVEGALILAHIVLYVGVLVATMTWAQAVVFLLVHQALFGVYLGCSFAPSHKGMPVLSAEDAADPLLRQVLTSRNIRGGPFVGFALGGLNLQIEHHLFPSMPRPNLRRAHPIIWDYCLSNDIPCQETTLLDAYGSALKHLQTVGAPLRRPNLGTAAGRAAGGSSGPGETIGTGA